MWIIYIYRVSWSDLAFYSHTQGGIHILNVLEITSILACELHPNELAPQSILCTRDAIRITPAFAVAISIMTLATIVRLACYRELGRHFTFELSIKEDHELITSGPYACVRHPGYIACICYLGSVLVCQLGRGSWWYGSAFGNSLIGVCVASLWVALNVESATFFVSRAELEDQVLQNEFGLKWEEWRKRTPCKLIPYIW